MRKIILENQIGVLIEKGRFVKELGPGEVRYSRFLKHQNIEVFDARPVHISLPENVQTNDQATVVLTINLSYRISEPMLFLKTVANAWQVVQTTVQDLARSWANTLSLDELLATHRSLPTEIEKKAKASLKQYGITLDHLSPPVLTLPRALKQAVEAKTIATRKAQADLEEARGRTAVLRHYANAARLVADNPELLKLLLGQKAKSLQVQFTDSERRK